MWHIPSFATGSSTQMNSAGADCSNSKLMAAAIKRNNPRNSTTYGTPAAILKLNLPSYILDISTCTCQTSGLQPQAMFAPAQSVITMPPGVEAAAGKSAQSVMFSNSHDVGCDCRHVGGEKELREAIELYTHLQHTMEDIHGLRNAQSALALRSIADVHMMLKEYGAPLWPELQT